METRAPNRPWLSCSASLKCNSCKTPSLFSTNQRLSEMKSVNVRRTGLMLRADPARVLVRPFNPSTLERARKICARVLALPEREVDVLLEEVLAEFGERHLKTKAFLKDRFEQVRRYRSEERRVGKECRSRWSP